MPAAGRHPRPTRPGSVERPLPGLLIALLLVAACGATPSTGSPVGSAHTTGPGSLAPGSFGASPGESVAGAASPARSPGPGTSGAPATTASPAPATPTATTPTPGPTTPAPPVSQLVGQRLVVAMSGTSPSDAILGRITRGEIGGVILFRANIASPDRLRVLTRQLRDAATAGGQPPLLVFVDQEGGIVKRIDWAPPWLSAPEMGRDGRLVVALSQGSLTGSVLRDLGIDVDLAPVADVPVAGTPSFMERDGRTFSRDAALTATLATAFAQGLVRNGVIPAMKHFPGIGLAGSNTDTSVVVISAPASRLEPGLAPYRTAIAEGIPLIMLSNAVYPAYDRDHAASWSSAITEGLLRDRLGFRGVTITDSVDGIARARGVETTELALLAAAAGVDLVLTTGSEPVTARIHAALLGAALDGRLSHAALEASYERIVALKAGR